MSLTTNRLEKFDMPVNGCLDVFSSGIPCSHFNQAPIAATPAWGIADNKGIPFQSHLEGF
jgi:hypothetical protein